MAQDQQKVTDALFLGNLDSQVTKAMLYDVCVQAGPVARISLPEASTDGRPKFGFCFYESVESAKYAHALFQNNVRLFGNTMRVDYSPQGNPEASGPQSSMPVNSNTVPLVVGQLTAAGGGTILKRKPRNPNS